MNKTPITQRDITHRAWGRHECESNNNLGWPVITFPFILKLFVVIPTTFNECNLMESYTNPWLLHCQSNLS